VLRVFLGRLQQAEHFAIRGLDRFPLPQFCLTGDECLAQFAVHGGLLMDHPHFEQIRAGLFFPCPSGSSCTAASQLKASRELTRLAEPRRLGCV
jgi:hypothetical protein